MYKSARRIGALTPVMFFFLISSGYTQSANTPKRDFKFGKISTEEFAITPPGADTAAAAIKIFDVGSCDFKYSSHRGFTYVYNRHIRYKILNKSGYDLANMEIPLFRSTSGGNKENIVSMSASTYNLENDKIVESKLRRDAKFTDVLDKNYTIKKYALPNVREGCIIEFKFSIESDYLFNLRGWNFQSDIPTLWSEYNVSIPEYFRYKTNLTGYWPINRAADRRESVTYVNGLTSFANYTKYVSENVPALKDEPYVTTLDDYRCKIEFELQGTQFPNDTYKDYTGSWPKIIKLLEDDENFGQYLNKKSYAKSLAAQIVGNETDPAKKAGMIYSYVNHHINWDKDYALYTNAKTPKAVFDKKSGNSSEINLALISLLDAADITVYPVLVSTRENGIHPGYPVLSKFNNVVARAIIGTDTCFLDACNKLLPMGMLSYDNLCYEAFSVDLHKKTGQWVQIKPPVGGESSYYYTLNLTDENTLKGSILEYHKGYNGLSRRNKYRNSSNETEYLKTYTQNKAGLEVLSYEIINLDSVDNTLIEKMEIDIEDNVEEAGPLVYFSPLLFERTKENPFKPEERKFPVNFGFPIKEIYRITLNFPENYEIETLPKSMVYKLPDNNGIFTISYFLEGNTMAVNSLIDIKKEIYSPEEYFDLKELFNVIVQRQAEQIVFKRN